MLGFAPYLHAAPRRNSITPDRQRAFIAALAASGIVTQAARTIGASLEALYNLRQQPGAKGFAAAWEAALARGLARLEDCALERALQGTTTPIVSGGQLLGWYDKPDNAMLRFLLQQRLPQRYGNGGFGGTGAGSGGRPIQPGHPVWEAVKDAVQADPATRAAEARLREALAAEKLKARRLEYSEGELQVEIERLEAALEEEAEYIAQLRRLLRMDPDLAKQDPRGLRRVGRG